MEEIKMPKKKFKFKIRVQADYHEADVPGQVTFLDAVNDWYTKAGGKKSLETYFNSIKSVNDYSSYDRFEFGDSVDKETYD